MPSFTRLAAASAAVLTSFALPAHAGDDFEFNAWGVVGSVGVPDEASATKVALNDRTVTFKAGTSFPATATLRYQLPAGALGLWGSRSSNGRQFSVRFLDSGDGAAITIKVKRASYTTPQVTTVWEWSSDEVTWPEPGLEYRTSVSCNYGVQTDFTPSFSYWVEVQLAKTDPAATVAFSDLLIQRQLEC